MPILGFSDSNKLYKKSTHRRKDSCQLNVFEAERCVGSINGASVCYSGTGFHQKTMIGDKLVRGGGRTSFDMRPMKSSFPSQPYTAENQLKEKKQKQPSSPGGRLASFLNSLFNQATSKKKKPKSKTPSVKDEEESPGGKRKRRNSISHFRSVSAGDSKPLYSSSSSGFRTPPHYTNTASNVSKNINGGHPDQKQVVSQSRCNVALKKEVMDYGNGGRDLAWLDEKFLAKNSNDRVSEKDRTWVDHYPSEKKDYDKFDDGDQWSDSSSDLFELQNHDFGYYSRDLPVYETTHMDSIKRGTAIVNGCV